MNTKSLQKLADVCMFVDHLSTAEKVSIIKMLLNKLDLSSKVDLAEYMFNTKGEVNGNEIVIWTGKIVQNNDDFPSFGQFVKVDKKGYIGDDF